MEICTEELLSICRAFAQAGASAPTTKVISVMDSCEAADALDSLSTRRAISNAIGRAAPARLEWSGTLCDGESVDHAAAEKACAALGEGWRLPTRMELESILDLTRHDPAIDTVRFPDTKSSWYWTSTPCAWASSCAWFVSFSYGGASGYHRVSGACVRAVRSVPAGQ